MDLSKVDLKPILPSGTIMIVNIQGAATVGKPLSETQLLHVLEAAQLALDFDDDRTKILNYVESRMTFIAPNLSAIVGTRTAARLMGVAGGIAALSRIPSCNIITLGANRLVATGLSRISNKAHEGLIFSAPIIQSSPPDLRKKFAKILSNK
jgi:U4/U6 small nuclear ribonucleoprotein PRP31